MRVMRGRRRWVVVMVVAVADGGRRDGIQAGQARCWQEAAVRRGLRVHHGGVRCPAARAGPVSLDRQFGFTLTMAP